MEIINRKAKFDYFIEEEYEAGIVLTGTEIKSIRKGSCNIKDCYGIIRHGEIYLLNMFIGQYKEGNIFNHEETRDRKLLLHKKEIYKLRDKVEMNGYTIVPLKVYFSKNYVKVLLGLGKGKKNYDKREAMKKRDTELYLKKMTKY